MKPSKPPNKQNMTDHKKKIWHLTGRIKMPEIEDGGVPGAGSCKRAWITSYYGESSYK